VTNTIIWCAKALNATDEHVAMLLSEDRIEKCDQPICHDTRYGVVYHPKGDPGDAQSARNDTKSDLIFGELLMELTP
jgi:hypothetical protein